MIAAAHRGVPACLYDFSESPLATLRIGVVFLRVFVNSRKFVILEFVPSSIFNDLRLAFALQYNTSK